MYLVCHAALLLILGATENSQAEARDLAALQGQWTLSKWSEGYTDTDWLSRFALMQLKRTPFVLRGRDLILRGKEQDKDVVFHLTIDPSYRPARIDVAIRCKPSPGTARLNGTILRGVYKISGDTLTICVVEGPGRRRPTDFRPPHKPQERVLLIFTRPTQRTSKTRETNNAKKPSNSIEERK